MFFSCGSISVLYGVMASAAFRTSKYYKSDALFVTKPIASADEQQQNAIDHQTEHLLITK